MSTELVHKRWLYPAQEEMTNVRETFSAAVAAATPVARGIYAQIDSQIKGFLDQEIPLVNGILDAILELTMGNMDSVALLAAVAEDVEAENARLGSGGRGSRH
ncbi:hypothetical protein [Dactylosporangium darangshiense]|uniref:hypothetical protein n=1 Tax=Dactylosporangium darangshiense TaxID=579108 RepID=UPI0031EF372B